MKFNELWDRKVAAMNFNVLCCVTLAGAFTGAPVLACMPMPPNAAYEIQGARAAFVGRVTSVEPGDQAACLRAAHERAADDLPYDPGDRACEAFGFATLEPAWIIKGEEVVSGPYRVAWNRTEFCAVGWTAQVGGLAVAMIPEDASTLREGATAVIDGGQQGDLLVRIILELVQEVQP